MTYAICEKWKFWVKLECIIFPIEIKEKLFLFNVLSLKGRIFRNELKSLRRDIGFQWFWKRWGKSGNSGKFHFLGSKVTVDSDCSHKINDTCSWKKSYDQPRQNIKKQRHDFDNTGLCSQSYCFSSSHVWIWELDHKKGWVPKNWCFQTVVLEKSLESPLDSKEIKPVNPKGNQSWIFIGRTDAEAEAPIVWPPDVKSRLIGKVPDAGKDWGQEKKQVSENEMVEYHQLNGHEFEQTLGESKGHETWCSAVRGIAKVWIRLNKITKSDFSFNILHAWRWSKSKLCLLNRRIQNSDMNIICVLLLFLWFVIDWWRWQWYLISSEVELSIWT